MTKQQKKSKDKLLDSMNAKLCQLDFAGADEESWTIHKVLHSIRDKHSEDYDPKIISIGPIHAGKKTLELMESLKWRYLQDLLNRRKDDRDMLEKYINKVRELEARAKKRYAGVVGLGGDAFVRIMVVDACFIIERLIRTRHGATRREKVHEIKWCLPLLRNDLLLLENQIPFFIVRSLFELSNIPDVPDLEKMAIYYVTAGKSESITATVDPRNAYHLLHLYHSSFLPPRVEDIPPTSCRHQLMQTSAATVMRTIKKIRSLASGAFFGLLFAVLYCRLPLKCSKCHRQQDTDEESRRAPRMLPSATELDESGVQFKRKQLATSLLDVTFRDGVMEIPFLSIHDHTSAELRNLVTFEQCCPTSGGHFTSYVVFLGNLINTPKDVAVLKKHGVIDSMLGQDEEVAGLFNSLDKGIYLDFQTHKLAQLFKDVNQYCEVDDHRWRARLVQDYFGTPWSTISVIAAILLLIFTVVQAIYAIIAYHKPPK